MAAFKRSSSSDSDEDDVPISKRSRESESGLEEEMESIRDLIEEEAAKAESEYQAKEEQLKVRQERELRQLQVAVTHAESSLDEIINHKMAQMPYRKECFECCSEFSEEVAPAIIVPCGHSKTCIKCCSQIWDARRPESPAKCPVCLTPIRLKPQKPIY